MKVLGLIGFLIFSQTPAEMEQVMKEFERIDCQKTFEVMTMQCLDRCNAMKKDPSAKDGYKACAQQCDDMLSKMSSQCQQMKKQVESFKKKSPEEQERILKEAAAEATQEHH